MSSDSNEEIEVLKSIYSSENESVDLKPSGLLNVKTSEVTLILDIPTGYPEHDPPILHDLVCHLGEITRDEGRSIIHSTYEREGVSCLYSIIESFRELARKSGTENKRVHESAKKVSDHERFLALELDHIRNEKKYRKNLEKWTNDLGIKTRLIRISGLKNPYIFVLGSESFVKEFLARLRTRNVDEDSRGRPCKERMSRVLCSSDINRRHPCGLWDGDSFCVLSEKSDNIIDFLSLYNLSELLNKFIF